MNELSYGRVGARMGDAAEMVSKIAMLTIITVSATKVAAYLRAVDLFLVGIIGTMFGLSFSGYALAWVAGRLLGVDRSTRIAMTFAGGMRNISVGVVIGTGFTFPDVLLPVVVCTLFQQASAAIWGHLFGRRRP